MIYFIKKQNNPLKALEHVLQDFPKYGHLISQYPSLHESTSMIKKIQKELKENVDFVHGSSVWLNGILLESEKWNIFEYFYYIYK